MKNQASLQQMNSMMEALHAIHARMESSKGLFPSYHEQLSERYQQLLQEARELNMTPPWIAA